jgi:chromosome segregation ATPase
MLNSLFPKSLTPRVGWTVGLAALALAGVASGQARRPDATLDELVVEVQALRAEMNQAAAASIKTQLLVGRLQMEDQRIFGVVRELETVQNELASSAQGRADGASRLKALEDALISTSGAAREDVERELSALRGASDQADRRLQALKRRESGLAKELQDEQARWTEINARLENVEQTIPGQQ